MNPLAEKLGISIEKAGVWRITPDGLERIEEQPVIRCEAITRAAAWSQTCKATAAKSRRGRSGRC